MAVGFGASSESHTGITGSTSEASFSWTHAGGASPRGVVVFVMQALTAADSITGVTYGGTAMTAVPGGNAADTASEPGRCKAYFLGASVPTGNQTVTVSRTNNATIMYAVAASVTAAADTEATGVVLLQENQAVTHQAVDDGSPGTNSMRFAGCYTGDSSPLPADTSSTLLQSIDFGAYGCSLVRETTAGQGSRNVGFVKATADDLAAVHLAVREVAAAGNTLDVTAGTVAISGVSTTLRAARQIAAARATVPITGVSATLRRGYTLTVSAGTVAILGRSTTLAAGRKLAATQATVPIVGVSATLKAGRQIAGSPATLPITGISVTLSAGRLLAASPATVAITGQEVTLTASTAGNVLTVSPATVALTGQSVTLLADRRLVATQATLPIAGQSATLSAGRRLAASPATVTIAGQSVTLTAGRLLTATANTVAITGQSVTLDVTRSGNVLTVTPATVAVVGQEVVLTYTPAVSDDVPLGAGSYAGYRSERWKKKRRQLETIDRLLRGIVEEIPAGAEEVDVVVAASAAVARAQAALVAPAGPKFDWSGLAAEVRRAGKALDAAEAALEVYRTRLVEEDDEDDLLLMA